MSPRINVVDLFASPGGLGEGFSGFADGRGRRSPHPPTFGPAPYTE
jgi:hypothetical protein